MKKLYRKGQVHPSPSFSPTFDEFVSLSFLPAAIFTLAAALSSQDKEVLAYLLSCSSTTTPFHFDPCNKSSKTNLNKNNKNSQQPHNPSFSCYCFTCYTNYWALWDSSPNRQLIHEIIDAFEDNLVAQNKKNKHGLTRRGKRKNNNNNNKGVLRLDDADDNKKIVDKVNDDDGVNGLNGLARVNAEISRVDSVEEVCDETMEKQGSHVRKIVSFIGERLWGSVWG